MEWRFIKRAGKKTIDGDDYDLSHLQDSVYAFTIAATKGYPEINAEMLIQYSSHCVSIGPARGERFDFEALGQDRLILDDRGNERCFCTARYTWSKRLPDIIRSLPGDRICYFTGHQNWLSIEILDPQSVRQVYEVFFNLTRQGNKYLRVYVESAYVRTAENNIRRPSSFRKEAKARGSVLLAKKLRNQSVSRPGHR